MGCTGRCEMWEADVMPGRPWYSNPMFRYCRTCDRKIDKVKMEAAPKTFKTTIKNNGGALRPNKCQCCHNTLRSSPVERKDNDTRKETGKYPELQRVESELIDVDTDESATKELIEIPAGVAA